MKIEEIVEARKHLYKKYLTETAKNLSMPELIDLINFLKKETEHILGVIKDIRNYDPGHCRGDTSTQMEKELDYTHTQLDKVLELYDTNEQTPIREIISSVQHDIWSNWMAYLFKCCNVTENGEMIIPKEKVKQWTRQINTQYLELSEEEKSSDRNQADKILKLLNKV